MSKKKRCKGCKVYYPADTFEIQKPFNNFHTVKCFQAWLKRQEDDKRRKDYIKHFFKHKGRKQTPLNNAKRAAREACHTYIRYRDKDQPCICCGKPITDEMHAGHYLSAGNHSFIRYHEDNIHGQSRACNYYSGDTQQYRINLIKKLGIERVLWLERNKNNPIKRTVEDYREIERHYKRKLKKLQEDSIKD